MKIFTILLFITILLHQYYLPVVNSIFIMELMGFVLFCVIVWPWWKDFRRRQVCRRELKNHSKNYVSPKENKDWRKRSQTQVQVTKEDLFDKI